MLTEPTLIKGVERTNIVMVYPQQQAKLMPRHNLYIMDMCYGTLWTLTFFFFFYLFFLILYFFSFEFLFLFLFLFSDDEEARDIAVT